MARARCFPGFLIWWSLSSGMGLGFVFGPDTTTYTFKAEGRCKVSIT